MPKCRSISTGFPISCSWLRAFWHATNMAPKFSGAMIAAAAESLARGWLPTLEKVSEAGQQIPLNAPVWRPEPVPMIARIFLSEVGHAVFIEFSREGLRRVHVPRGRVVTSPIDLEAAQALQRLRMLHQLH